MNMADWSMDLVPKRDADFYETLKSEFFSGRERGGKPVQPYAPTITGLLNAARRKYHERTWRPLELRKDSQTLNDLDELLIERIVTHYGGPTIAEAEALYKQDRDAFRELDLWLAYSVVLLARGGCVAKRPRRS